MKTKFHDYFLFFFVKIKEALNSSFSGKKIQKKIVKMKGIVKMKTTFHDFFPETFFYQNKGGSTFLIFTKDNSEKNS